MADCLITITNLLFVVSQVQVASSDVANKTCLVHILGLARLVRQHNTCHKLQCVKVHSMFVTGFSDGVTTIVHHAAK